MYTPEWLSNLFTTRPTDSINITSVMGVFFVFDQFTDLSRRPELMSLLFERYFTSCVPMLCWYSRPTLRVIFWWAYFTSNIIVSGYHIRIILLHAAYIRSSIVAYIATQHAQHAISNFATHTGCFQGQLICTSHFLVAFWSRLIFGWFSVNTSRNSIKKQAHSFTGTNNATPTTLP